MASWREARADARGTNAIHRRCGFQTLPSPGWAVLLSGRQKAQRSLPQLASRRRAIELCAASTCMSISTSPNAINDPPNIRYPSLAALQAAHNALLQLQRQDADAPTFLA